MQRMDWNLLHTFVVVAEAGSLSAAARRLKTAQPTVGRHIAELSDQLGIALFKRHARGLELTERGRSLYERAKEVNARVDDFARRASGLSEGLAGAVRISASEVVANFALPVLLAELVRTYPQIELEIVADNGVANLLHRDADIAVRMFRPTQQELVARKVAEAPLALYASAAYLADFGTPQTVDELRQHRVVGLDRDSFHLKALAAHGIDLEREDFSVRSDTQSFHVHAVVAGLAIGAIQKAVAARLPGLLPVLSALQLTSLSVWLVAHDDLQRSPRVRAVYDALATGLSRYYTTAN